VECFTSLLATHTPPCFLWCHQESNRGHTDFQSVALPTELWHLFGAANLNKKLCLTKLIQFIKTLLYPLILLNLSTENMFICIKEHSIKKQPLRYEVFDHFLLLYLFIHIFNPMEYFTHILDNGIRLVHQPTDSPVAHCGVMINTGSRDELEDQQGLAHFVEHLIFKGTHKRKAHHILSRMEDVGGEINAFTTKEETCIHSTFFNDYYDRAFELMFDTLFNSTFPEKEVSKEKEVIIDEINSYKDSPIELMYDDFEEILFEGNSIARNILGNEEALNRYDRSHLQNFFSINYPTEEMVVSSAGSIHFERIVDYFSKYFSQAIVKKRSVARSSFNTMNFPTHLTKREKNTYQTHCIMGTQAYNNREEKRLILHLLNNMLGGPGMNSRLNMALRENKGLAYNVESYYGTYSDIGIVHIYFGTGKEDLEQCIQITLRELKKLREKKLGSIQLSKSKKQLIGQIAISAENYENQMLANARSILLFDRIERFDELNEKINKITANELIEVANEIFSPDKLSTLIYQ
jgi:predicted Zn-dependent peptidase